MKYLVVTCVISEIAKIKPNKKVIHWISSRQEDFLYLSSLTIGEIQKGISKLAESKRRGILQAWIDNELKERFSGRILDVNIDVAKTWGKIQAIAEKQGKMIPAIDSLIAATGIYYKLTVVTRDVTDMKMSGVSLFNPWE